MWVSQYILILRKRKVLTTFLNSWQPFSFITLKQAQQNQEGDYRMDNLLGQVKPKAPNENIIR